MPVTNFNTTSGELLDTYDLRGFNIRQAIDGTNDVVVIDEMTLKGGIDARCYLKGSLVGLVPS
jgi:hypothetical protein